MDVSADISVMKAMMEQEGLTGSKPGSGSYTGKHPLM